METTVPDKNDIDYCKSRLGLIETVIEQPVVKEFSMEEFMKSKMAGVT